MEARHYRYFGDGAPVKDSILAVTDESYFDWPVLPEAPSSLNVSFVGNTAKLTWQVHGGDITGIVVERQLGDALQTRGRWGRITQLPATATEYADPNLKKQPYGYRVRAVNANGQSAYSNIARIIGR